MAGFDVAVDLDTDRDGHAVGVLHRGNVRSVQRGTAPLGHGLGDVVAERDRRVIQPREPFLVERVRLEPGASERGGDVPQETAGLGELPTVRGLRLVRDKPQQVALLDAFRGDADTDRDGRPARVQGPRDTRLLLDDGLDGEPRGGLDDVVAGDRARHHSGGVDAVPADRLVQQAALVLGARPRRGRGADVELTGSLDVREPVRAGHDEPVDPGVGEVVGVRVREREPRPRRAGRGGQVSLAVEERGRPRLRARFVGAGLVEHVVVVSCRAGVRCWFSGGGG